MSKYARPAHMSQLDYLWTYYSDYSISNTTTDDPTQTVLTEQGVIDLINNIVISANGVSQLVYRQHPTATYLMQIVGLDLNGNELTSIDVPKEITIANFSDHIITSSDIDLGCPFEIGTTVILLEQSDGTRYYINLDKYRTSISGSETDSIKVTVSDEGVISADLKTDNEDSVITLETGENGVKANLNVDSSGDTGIVLSTDDNILTAQLIWNTIEE